MHSFRARFRKLINSIVYDANRLPKWPERNEKHDHDATVVHRPPGTAASATILIFFRIEFYLVKISFSISTGTGFFSRFFFFFYFRLYGSLGNSCIPNNNRVFFFFFYKYIIKYFPPATVVMGFVLFENVHQYIYQSYVIRARRIFGTIHEARPESFHFLPDRRKRKILNTILVPLCDSIFFFLPKVLEVIHLSTYETAIAVTF